jgi:hypothetical protein
MISGSLGHKRAGANIHRGFLGESRSNSPVSAHFLSIWFVSTRRACLTVCFHCCVLPLWVDCRHSPMTGSGPKLDCRTWQKRTLNDALKSIKIIM